MDDSNNKPADRDAAADLPILDLESLKQIMGDNVDLILEIVEVYEDSLPADAKKLEDALEKGEVVEVERSAHSIKGGAANLGAKRLHRTAAQIEDAARDGDTDAFTAKASLLRREIDLLFGELEKLKQKAT